MELFLKVVFKFQEFDRIQEVMYNLTEEGWEVVDETEFSTIKQNREKIITSKEYKLKRKV